MVDHNNRLTIQDSVCDRTYVTIFYSQKQLMLIPFKMDPKVRPAAHCRLSRALRVQLFIALCGRSFLFGHITFWRLVQVARIV